jgi:PAS domain S-box
MRPQPASKFSPEDAFLTNVFRHASVGMALIQENGNWLMVNPALSRLLGYTEGELLNIPLRKIVYRDDLRSHMAFARRLSSGETSSYNTGRRYLHRDGSEVSVTLNISVVRDDGGTFECFLVQVLDAGNVSQVGITLEREQELLAHLMATSPDHIYFKDLKGRFIRVNPAKAKRHGLSHPDEAIGKTDFDYFEKEHATRTTAEEQRLLTTGRPLLDREEFFAWPDGQISWMSTSRVARTDRDGRIIGLIGISRDITERKLVEEKMRYSEQRYRSVVEATTSIVWSTPASGKFQSAQPGWTAFTGQTPEELWGWGWLDAIHPDDRATTIATWKNALEHRDIYQVRHRLRRHDGTYRYMSGRGIPIIADDGEILEWLGVHTDITERKVAELEKERLNRELVELSRRSGMSEVATNVLHNVGNVLNSVNISSSVITEKVKSSRIGTVTKTAALLQDHKNDLATFLATSQGRQLPDFLQKLSSRLSAEQNEILAELELLDRNIEHISQIVSVQQSYAYVGGFKESVSVAELLDDALRMNSMDMESPGVTVIRDYADVPPIEVEKHKVMQILVNLIRNAKHALLDNDIADPRLTLRVLMNDPETLQLVVKDNGVGIDPENLTRIFSHGFTTKREGHGFGLHGGALASAEIGGSLMVHSDGRGKGATFTLALPIHSKSEASPT